MAGGQMVRSSDARALGAAVEAIGSAARLRMHGSGQAGVAQIQSVVRTNPCGKRTQKGGILMKMHNRTGWIVWTLATGLILLGVILALTGCSQWGGLGSLPKPGPVDPKNPNAHPVAILNWIIAGCMLAAVACTVCSFVAAGLWGLGAGLLRKAGGALAGCALGGIIFRVIVIKYLWLLVLLSVLSGVAFMLLWIYGHRKCLEKFLGIDFDGDGKIGEATPM